MTVTVSKPALILREEISALKKPSGIKGEELLRSNTVSDAYTALNPVMFRNRIINGDMRIDQRNASASVTTSALQQLTYTVDRWSYYNDVVSKRTVQQVTTAPPGFRNSLKVTVIATDTAGPQQFLRQTIEGYNLADLNWGTTSAQPAVLSFWVRSSIPGQHGGAIQSTNTDWCFPFAYYINVADTWEYKTVQISGATTGSWGSTNNAGASIQFENGVGYQKSPANVWLAVNATASTGSVNLCATNGATWYITGVQFEKGTVATPFEFRPFPVELALCQRYYWQHSISIWVSAILDGGSSDYPGAFIQHPVPMRITPTGSFLSVQSFYYNNGSSAVNFIPSGGTTNWVGNNIVGYLRKDAISNPPGAAHCMKVGFWYIQCAFNAEL